MLATPLFVDQMLNAVGDDFGHGPVCRERHVLHQTRDMCTRLPPHAPGVGLEIAGNDLKQRGLPRAVSTDHRNALAHFHLQRNAFQQRQMTVSDRYLVQNSKRHCLYRSEPTG